jgi:hypothetical protein
MRVTFSVLFHLGKKRYLLFHIISICQGGKGSSMNRPSVHEYTGIHWCHITPRSMRFRSMGDPTQACSESCDMAIFDIPSTNNRHFSLPLYVELNGVDPPNVSISMVNWGSDPSIHVYVQELLAWNMIGEKAGATSIEETGYVLRKESVSGLQH